MTTATPDSLWAEIAPLVVLPSGSRPLMQDSAPCKDRGCEVHVGGVGVVPIPRSLPAALAALPRMGPGVRTAWVKAERSTAYPFSADSFEVLVLSTILKALKKERDA